MTQKRGGMKRRRSQLRTVAEAQLARAPQTGAKARPGEEVLHDLEVHQIELEMQNEELRRTQLALEASRDRYVNLYEFAPVGYLTLTGEGLISEVNLTAAALLGEERKKMLRRRFNRFVTREDGDRYHRLFVSLMQHDERQACELALQRGDGSTFHARLDCVRVAAGDTPPVARITLTDVTDHKRVEDQMRRLVTELSEADRSKNEFLAMLAHELRNPLAPIASALQILRRTDAGDASNTRANHVMERQMQKMVRLIDDLLDVSRISRGKIDLQKERVDLAEVVNSAVETSQPLIDAAGQQLTVSLPPDLTYLDADPTRLAQVFSNLLTNAAKYTPRGGLIWLSVEREGRKAVVRVRDTGIGIGPDMLPHVFDMFVQVDHSFERVRGGLGIGLTLVRTIVQLHGGSVQADSAGLGQGSEFTVRLPVASRESQESATRLPRTTGGAAVAVRTRRILIVDDNVDAAEMVGMQVTLMGHEVRIACDAFAALEAARSYRPEIAFLDIGLPGMNGYELARRLRSELGDETPVLVALTGFGGEEDRRRSRESGFEYHLVKPAEADVLEKLVATLRSAQAQRRN